MLERLKIDPHRLDQRIQALAKIGAQGPGAGVTRRAFSDEEAAAKRYIAELCQGEGLSLREDGAGNLIARLGPPGPAVLTGSHLDSVPNGGHLDGAYGVVAGVEALSVLRTQQHQLKRAVELVAFTDEEGRFGSMIGSRCMSGLASREELLEARDESGRSLESALEARGSSIDAALAAARDQAEVSAFVELHIEQGPLLESRGLTLGVVEEIVGIQRWRASFTGEANHAGTTPMALRKDAFVGLTDFATQLHPILAQYGTDAARGTIGEVSLSPGYMGVVPEVASFSLDLRDRSLSALREMEQALRQHAEEVAAARGLTLSVSPLGGLTPTRCAPELVELIDQLAREGGETPLRMVSGATHDAVPMSALTPVGMIFVPSSKGVSHSPKEWTSPEALACGAELLLNTLYQLATRDADG